MTKLTPTLKSAILQNLEAYTSMVWHWDDDTVYTDVGDNYLGIEISGHGLLTETLTLRGARLATARQLAQDLETAFRVVNRLIN